MPRWMSYSQVTPGAQATPGTNSSGYVVGKISSVLGREIPKQSPNALYKGSWL